MTFVYIWNILVTYEPPPQIVLVVVGPSCVMVLPLVVTVTVAVTGTQVEEVG